MTRIAIELPRWYPRKYVWFMECDTCQTTHSEPAWSTNDLSLEMFRERGWLCGKLTDTCPACLQKESA